MEVRHAMMAPETRLFRCTYGQAPAALTAAAAAVLAAGLASSAAGGPLELAWGLVGLESEGWCW